MSNSNLNDWFQLCGTPFKLRYLNSKPISTITKPIRRRSRASKKTPTTHLQANTSNFRELVQQFTGCPQKSLTLESNFKGPVNLDFKLGHVQNDTGFMDSCYDYDQYDRKRRECSQMDGFEDHVTFEGGGGREEEEGYGDLRMKQRYTLADCAVACSGDDANRFEPVFIDLEADDSEMDAGMGLVMMNQIQSGCFVNEQIMATEDNCFR